MGPTYLVRPVVLLDCDGVLADFIGRVCDTIEAFGGPRYEPHHVTEFNFTKALGLDDSLARKVKRAISDDSAWWSTLPPFPEAITGVAALREVADVYIVTSPWNSNRTWLHARESWLKHHFDIPHSHVIACSAKHLVRGDVFVDDKTEAVAAWQAAHRDAIAVQWETPHNRNDGWTGRSTRSWADVRHLTTVRAEARVS